LLCDLELLPFDEDCARIYGRIRGGLLRQGRGSDEVDLMIAAVALANDLTLVTHNVADFAIVPDLRIVDWLAP